MTDLADNSDLDNARLMDQIERTIPPMDLGDAENLLLEVKDIFDRHGVVFFLRQGTCLGAVRDQGLIPWDDDLDLGSIFGMHGFSEELIDPAVESLRANDCYVEVHREGLYTAVKIMKYRIRIDWQCYHEIEGTIAHYPGVPFPVDLFRRLREISFLGTSFHVPEPPEDYLVLKYGPEWRTPKRVGYEKDVLDAMPRGVVPGRPGPIRQFLTATLLPSRAANLLVLDLEGRPVRGAEVSIAGLNRSKTNRRGIARFFLPERENYAVTIKFGDFEEVLYEEALAPGSAYVYRPDPERTEGRYFVLEPA